MENKEMPFLDHLEELRWRIIKALISIVVFTVIAFTVSDYILDWLLLPASKVEAQISLQVLKIQAIFIIKLEIALIVGVVLSLPVILYQIWVFLSPGLHKHERKYVWPLIIFAMISFCVGGAFAYYILVPYTLEFFLALAPSNVENNIAIDFYFGFIFRLILVFGIVFELPVLSVILSRLGLISPSFLRKYRRHFIVIFFVAAAILTPPDPTTQVILAIPLVLLYEVTIFISYIFQKKRKKTEDIYTED
jgi:sec-independent protein translocase protein TatC